MSDKPSLFAETAGSQRFPMLLDKAWRWATVLVGATRENSYVEIGQRGILFRYGWFFRHAFPVVDISQASLTNPGWWSGVGVHTNLLGMVELSSATRNWVEVRFRTRRWVLMLIPAPCDRIRVTLEDPRAFLDALSKRGVMVIGKGRKIRVAGNPWR